MMASVRDLIRSWRGLPTSYDEAVAAERERTRQRRRAKLQHPDAYDAWRARWHNEQFSNMALWAMIEAAARAVVEAG